MNTPLQQFVKWYYEEENAPETTSGDMVHDMAKTAFLAGYSACEERIIRDIEGIKKEVGECTCTPHEVSCDNCFKVDYNKALDDALSAIRNKV